MFCILLLRSVAAAQDLTEDEETVEDSVIEDEDDEAEVEDDEPTDLVSVVCGLMSVHITSFYPFYNFYKFGIKILDFKGVFWRIRVE